MDTDKIKDNLSRAIEENPLAAVGVGATALLAVSKFVNAVVANRNSKT